MPLLCFTNLYNAKCVRHTKQIHFHRFQRVKLLTDLWRTVFFLCFCFFLGFHLYFRAKRYTAENRHKHMEMMIFIYRVVLTRDSTEVEPIIHIITGALERTKVRAARAMAFKSKTLQIHTLEKENIMLNIHNIAENNDTEKMLIIKCLMLEYT